MYDQAILLASTSSVTVKMLDNACSLLESANHEDEVFLELVTDSFCWWRRVSK
jgi:hypothetical protein